MSTSQSRKRVPLVGHVKPAAKELFVALTSEKDLTTSEGIARLVDWANKTGKIPK